MGESGRQTSGGMGEATYGRQMSLIILVAHPRMCVNNVQDDHDVALFYYYGTSEIVSVYVMCE